MLIFAKLAALAPMLIQFDQIIPYLKGDEFRAMVAEFITQVFVGWVSSFFDLLIQTLLSYSA